MKYTVLIIKSFAKTQTSNDEQIISSDNGIESKN